MRKLVIPVLLIVVCAVGIATAASRMLVRPATMLSNGVPAVFLKGPDKKPKRVIDGAVNPGLIPDQKAYLMLFRLLSNRHTDADIKSIRSYIRATDLGDENALLAVADEFERRVGELDRQAQQIHAQYGVNLDAQALAQLNALQESKEQIVAELVASLPKRLGADGAGKCQRHINERVKQKVKVAE